MATRVQAPTAMRVLHLDSEMEWRGGEQQVAYLISELNAFGVVNFVGCRAGSRLALYCRARGIAHRSLNFGGFQLRAARQIANYGHACRIDLVHLHTAKAHSAGVFAHLMGLRAPLVLSRRTAFPLRRNPLSRFKYKHPGIRYILCVSKSVKAVVDAATADSAPTVVVHSGIDLERFRVEPSGVNDLRRIYGFPRESILVGSVGALTVEKDHPTFIRTARRLWSADPRFRFLIIGKGPLAGELRREAARRGMADKIRFAGHLDQIERFLPGLDYLLITSRSEGFPGSVLEAMACRVPVVATCAGGIPEMVIHRQTGCLAAPMDDERLGEEILYLATHPRERAAIIANAREMVTTRFSKAATAAQTYRLYQRTLAGRAI